MNIFAVALLFVGLWSGCEYFDSEESVQYTVLKGDTLTKIARKHGVSVHDLKAWNALRGDRIDVGQVLTIMGSTVHDAGAATTTNRPTNRRPRTVVKRPVAKPCLKGPSLEDLDEDEPDIQGSVGLSRQQIRAPMNQALPGLSRCFAEGWPSGVLDLEFTVGCNGIVQTIRVIGSSGITDSAVRCMTKDLRAIGFPAHDMPDGMTFRYPITLSP